MTLTTNGCDDGTTKVDLEVCSKESITYTSEHGDSNDHVTVVDKQNGEQHDIKSMSYQQQKEQQNCNDSIKQQKKKNSNSSSNNTITYSKIGPQPTLLSRTEVDALYEMFGIVIKSLQSLNIQYIITGGSLLGSVRQQSILFCDDDIDIAILLQDDNDNDNNDKESTEHENDQQLPTKNSYERVVQYLQYELDKQCNCCSNIDNTTAMSSKTTTNNSKNSYRKYIYQIRPWEGGDRIRHNRMNNVFIDVFVIQKYNTVYDLYNVLALKTNGTYHTNDYIYTIVSKILHSLLSSNNTNTDQSCTGISNNNTNSDIDILSSSLLSLSPEEFVQSILVKYYSNAKAIFPLYHFTTRKAIELWPKEVYRPYELYPLQNNHTVGPYYNIVTGPHLPITLLYRAFGYDCFLYYYQSIRHNNNNCSSIIKQNKKKTSNSNSSRKNEDESTNIGKTSHENTVGNTKKTKELVPLISLGGLWESGTKVLLQDEHYLPMQPTLKQLRLPSTCQQQHCKQTLMEYIKHQSQYETTIIQRNSNSTKKQAQRLEQHEVQQQQKVNQLHVELSQKRTEIEIEQRQPPPHGLSTATSTCSDNLTNVTTASYNDNVVNKEFCSTGTVTTVYMDGVFDLFHIGHLEAIKTCTTLGSHVIIGITGDIDATSYKRRPIINEYNRCTIISSLQYVNKIICPCPLIVTQEFMNQHYIDLVVHGFANDDDYNKQLPFFQYPISTGQFKRIPYYQGLCTTDIIRAIQQQQKREEQQQQKECDNSTIDESSLQQPCLDIDKQCEQTTLEANTTSSRQSGNFVTDAVEEKRDNNIEFNNNDSSSKNQKYPQPHFFSSSTDTIPPIPVDEATYQSHHNNTSSRFGQLIVDTTNASSEIQFDPIPLPIRIAIEPHIAKTRQKRSDVLDKIRTVSTTGSISSSTSTTTSIQPTSDNNEDDHTSNTTAASTCFDTMMKDFISNFGVEGMFQFDTNLYDLRAAFLKSAGQHKLFDMTRLHQQGHAVSSNSTTTETTAINTTPTKYNMLQSLTQNTEEFHEAYDRFVSEVIAPKFASLVGCNCCKNINIDSDTSSNNISCLNTSTINEGTVENNRKSSTLSCTCCDTIYYQSYPCIRIIQPNEFSIGPHADVVYGHHPCSVNFYVPFTPIHGTSSLFLESRPGSEDWHPIQGDYGDIKHFAGAVCAHWTTENKTSYTRVSIDFRLIHGDHYTKLPHHRIDGDGYYSVCRRSSTPMNEWHRDNAVPLSPPDARMGFPWTVKNWNTLLKKTK